METKFKGGFSVNILQILGSIGGTIYFIGYVIRVVRDYSKWCKKYAEMKKFYEKEHNKKQVTKVPMGFKTEEEKKEIESKFKS